MSIDLTQDGHVATIRINRPEKLNALTLAMYEDLGRAFIAAKDDDCVRAVVLDRHAASARSASAPT